MTIIAGDNDVDWAELAWQTWGAQRPHCCLVLLWQEGRVCAARATITTCANVPACPARALSTLPVTLSLAILSVPPSLPIPMSLPVTQVSSSVPVPLSLPCSGGCTGGYWGSEQGWHRGPHPSQAWENCPWEPLCQQSGQRPLLAVPSGT